MPADQITASKPRSESNSASMPTSPSRDVRELTAAEIAFQRRAVLIVIGTPTLGLIAGVAVAWNMGGISLSDVVAFGIMVVITGLGITIGFHRMLTHQSFKTHAWLRGGFIIAGSMALEGPPIEWVADHRRHHAHSDDAGDPHSPVFGRGEGFWPQLGGFWHAHVGWMFKRERSLARRWAPDLLADPMVRRIDRLFPLWALMTLAMPAAIGFAVGGTVMSALTGLLWGGLVRIAYIHHVTWSINSICHYFGKRTYRTTDHSTNNRLLALVSFGESWHNNHHAFPTSAVHGLDRGQIDISGALIKLLERVGLVRDVRRPSEAARARKRLES